jgi:hypothetical protein
VRLRVVGLQLEEEDLVVFAQLQLVAIDALAEVVSGGAAAQLVEMVQALDGDGEDLAG